MSDTLEAVAPEYTEEAAIEPAEAVVEPAPEDPATPDGGSVAGDVADDTPARVRADLESEVRAVTDAFVQGRLTVEEGKSLTTFRIALAVQATRGDDGKRPSTGAIANLLKRWERYGYITLAGEAPVAFGDYTEDARTLGLSACKVNYRKANKAAKAAAKEAAAAGNARPLIPTVPTPEPGF